jgi:hypothetical protein
MLALGVIGVSTIAVHDIRAVMFYAVWFGVFIYASYKSLRVTVAIWTGCHVVGLFGRGQPLTRSDSLALESGGDGDGGGGDGGGD